MSSAAILPIMIRRDIMSGRTRRSVPEMDRLMRLNGRLTCARRIFLALLLAGCGGPGAGLPPIPPGTLGRLSPRAGRPNPHHHAGRGPADRRIPRQRQRCARTAAARHGARRRADDGRTGTRARRPAGAVATDPRPVGVGGGDPPIGRSSSWARSTIRASIRISPA